MLEMFFAKVRGDAQSHQISSRRTRRASGQLPATLDVFAAGSTPVLAKGIEGQYVSGKSGDARSAVNLWLAERNPGGLAR
jgi:hypothetical protein